MDFVFLVFRRDSFFKEWWIFYLEEEVSTMVGTGKGRRRECFYSSGENMLSYKLSRCHTRSNQRLKICVAWEEMRHGNSPKLYIDLFFLILCLFMINFCQKKGTAACLPFYIAEALKRIQEYTLL